MATTTADPYQTLGVARDADEAAIRAAYRTLAKKHHPDLNPGKADAAERFRAIASANELLSDPEKRARFDRGEIDAEGQERARPSRSYRDYAGADASAGQGRYTEDSAFDLGGFEGAGLDDILAQAFARKRGTSAKFPMRGLDAQYGLTVSFVDAAAGIPRRLTLPDGKVLDVTIPPGTETGTVLRLRGQGGTGRNGGAAGDALIEVTVAPDSRFRREGDDIVLTVPVTLKEAVLGAALTVPTVKGDVRVTVPPGSGTGTRLRLRGRGVRAGHQYVELTVELPPGDDPALAAFLRDWTPRADGNPRGGGDPRGGSGDA